MLIAFDLAHMLHLWMGACECLIGPHEYNMEERQMLPNLKWACYREWMLERQSASTHSTPGRKCPEEPGDRKRLAKGQSSPEKGKIKHMTSWENRWSHEKVSHVVRNLFYFQKPRANSFLFFARGLLRKWVSECPSVHTSSEWLVLQQHYFPINL